MTNRPATTRVRLGAFTLVEVMIAVALVMVLIVGVAQVFNMTSQTISAGQALQTVTRDARAAETMFAHDGRNMLTGNLQPALVIWSQRHWEFLDAAAQTSDLDGQPWTVDVDNDGIEGEQTVPGEIMSPALYNERNHRIDILAFFATGNFSRQTSPNATGIVGPGGVQSNEALISYGHLLVPTAPGSGDGALSPPQGFARDWRLGRTAILLDETANGAATGTHALDPLRFDSPTTPGGFVLGNSRFDVARTSLTRYTTKINGRPDWWQHAITFRFEAEPNPTPPYDAAAMARTVPVFLNNCTSFIVEYAGDYLDQRDRHDDPATPSKWGEIAGLWNPATGNGTDGKIDFYYEPGGSAATVNSKRRIRWYGLPRDIDGDGAINANDVIPLRDLWEYVRAQMTARGVADPGPCPFERDISTLGLQTVRRTVAQKTHGINEPPSNLGYADVASGMREDEGYYCAWGPDDRKPAMLRITLRMDDPNGRLPEGLWFQYVLELPGGP